jgi:hypothetical protein
VDLALTPPCRDRQPDFAAHTQIRTSDWKAAVGASIRWTSIGRTRIGKRRGPERRFSRVRRQRPGVLDRSHGP